MASRNGMAGSRNKRDNMEKMKRIGLCFAVAFVVLLSSLSFAAGSSSISSGSSSIGVFYIGSQSLYSPYPAEPGKYMDVWLRVQYRGEKTNVENVTCMIETRYPFSLDPGENPVKDVGVMTPYQEILLKYKIRIDENAVQGYNTFVFKCKAQGTTWYGTELSFYIQTHEAVLSIERIESIPEKFAPGETGKVNIYIKNLADSTVKDITVKLDLSGSDIPFAPVNSTIEKRMQDLPAKDSSVLAFDIIAMQDATAKTYKIPITLSYRDDLGSNYTKSTITALTVQTEQPELFITHEQTTYIRNGTKNAVAISIVNNGKAQVKFLSAELQDGAGYAILSPRRVYVGGIPSDDSEAAEFDLFIDTSEDKILLPLTVSFSDVDGKGYTLTKTVEAKVYSKDSAIRLGIDKAVTSDPVVLGLAAVIALYVLYRIVRFLFFRKKKV